MVSDLECFREVLPPDQLQYVFPLKRPDQGAALVTSLLRDPDRREALGRAARANSKRFDIRRIVRQVEGLYLESLAID